MGSMLETFLCSPEFCADFTRINLLQNAVAAPKHTDSWAQLSLNSVWPCTCHGRKSLILLFIVVLLKICRDASSSEKPSLLF